MIVPHGAANTFGDGYAMMQTFSYRMTPDILIIDDTLANLQLLTDILKEEGYRVRPALSGEVALQSARRKPPHLVLLDIKMPDMDGFEVCRHLKNDAATRDIPVIFISALSDTQDKLQAFRAGGVDYITKPFQFEEVKARVRTHLQLKEYQDFLGQKIQEGLHEIYALNHEITDTQREIILTLGAICETRSHETGQHVKRVAEYSSLLANLIGASGDECALIRFASPMHDIGKVAIPDAILNKPGALAQDEWAIMKTHTLLGYQMLSASQRPLLKMAATIALEHHERWDGSGYPRGLAGEDIHLAGRVTALADVFDALGSERCYKNAWPLEQIIAYVRDERGKHFDPRLVDVFLEHLDDFLAIRDSFPDVWENDSLLLPGLSLSRA